ncbi:MULTISPECIES: hypothetical protein [Bacillus]|uniref:hypothetical protein n=1 Tax=Bacillus TaxID=1386 RepID=UPI000BB88A03|nr:MULTISPECIES: hypothetical protein [Bacillus]
MEYLLYALIAPIFTIVFSLINTVRFKRYVLTPIIVFIVLNIPTVLLPLFANVGWEGLVGWALLYTGVSIVISLIVWAMRKFQMRRATDSKA